MILKEIGRKIAQAFRLARAADEKVASSIAAALDAKAEQIKEYEKRFEPEHPEPEPLPMQQVIQSLAAYGFSTDEAACAIAKAMAQKPKPLRNLTNNWTQTEVSRMKMLRKQGFTIREIAEKMDRSESSIKYKLYGREKSDGRS